MENKTAEEILEKYCPSMSNIYLDDNGIKFRARVVKSMEEYASIKLAEKDKEIEEIVIKAMHTVFQWVNIDNDNRVLGDVINDYLESLNK